MTNKTPVWEDEPCSRCGGGGEYSYCQSHGRTCFKCHGKGVVLTKRGAAAARFFSDSCSKPFADIEVGDVIRQRLVDMTSTYTAWFIVTEIDRDVPLGKTKVGDGEWTEARGMRIQSHNEKLGGLRTSCEPDSMVRVAHTGTEKRGKIAAALAYQDTLTKRGVVSKRAKNKTA